MSPRRLPPEPSANPDFIIYFLIYPLNQMTSTSPPLQCTRFFAKRVLIVALLILLSSCAGDEAPSPSPSDSAPVATTSEQEIAPGQVQEGAERDTTDRTGGVQGVVRNTEEEPLAKVNLFFAELEIGAATLGDGRYVIRGIPPGTHTLTVSHGQLQKKVEVEILPDSLVHLNVTLD